MKTIKELEHIVFRRSLGLNNRQWLSVAVGSFFHLEEPEKTGTSIELWKLAAETLGKGAILDGANPKQVGEFMVCGSCWSASGVPVVSSEVEVSVGKAGKRLYVYGDREWLPPGSESPLRISEPQPFVSMPVDWAHAYGGEGYALNPTGLGVKPQAPFDSWPLPNIETSAINRSSPEPATVTPAGYGMIGVKNPARRQNMGAYDQNWLENRWPYYPDDFDQRYFNCAAPDQRLQEGFFQPGDPIMIRNMHPAQPELQSHLPNLRQRAFILQQQGGKEVFLEAAMRLDTVWLWPEHNRGLVLARGMFPVADDEADDVKLLYTVTEPLSDPPLPLNDRYEKLQRRLARKVPYDLPPQIPNKDEALKVSNAKLESLQDELRKAKIGSDQPSAPLDMGVENIQRQILQDEAKIAALLENPQYGTALQVNALRQSIKSRRTGMQALREAALKKQEAAGFSVLEKIELPSAQMQDQLQQLQISNPQQYEKLAAELGKADAQVKTFKAKLTGLEQRKTGGLADNSALSPAELLIERAQNLMLERERELEELKQLQEPLKIDGFSILERDRAAKRLEGIERRCQRLRSDIEKIAGKAEQDHVQKDEVLGRLIEMTEHLAKLEWPVKQATQLDMAALVKQIMQEKLAEAQEALNTQTPVGVKAPDLAAELEKTLKVNGETGPDPVPNISKILDEIPPEALAQMSPEALKKLKDIIAGAEKSMNELMEKKSGGGLDLGKYHPSQKIMTREVAQQTVAGGGSLACCDFTDLDLSGLDLAGGHFDGAQFVRTKLRGTRFNGAVLSGTRFEAVDASEADFSEADLEKSRWLNKCLADKALFKKAKASGMKVLGCSFKQSDFSTADLHSAVFNKSTLDQACFHQAQMKSVTLIESSATACDFSASSWSNAVINGSDISFSSFQDCCSPKMLIWNSNAKALKANRAVLDRFVAGGEKTSLDDSCFDEATLRHSSQTNISAQRVSARRAILDRAYFQKVDISHSDYYGARAAGARLMRCTLNQVNMGAINLMGGSLRKSGLTKTDLSASCLHGVEFYQTKLVETRLDGAFTARSSLTAKQRLTAASADDEEKN